MISMKSINKAIKTVAQILYFPVYVVLGSGLHFIARILLAISYMALLCPRQAKDIIKSLKR